VAKPDELSTTVEKIYAAATDWHRWREALVAVENFTGSTGAVLNLEPLSEGAARYTMAGSFSRDNCLDYTTNYQAICPRIAYAKAHPDLPIHYDRMVLSEREMDRNSVYAWLATHGLRYFLAGNAGYNDKHFAYFSLQRSRRQGHVDVDDVARFEMVRPHLVQAIALAGRLDTLTAHRRFSDAMLDALSEAVFGLDRGGGLLFVNRAGDRLLERRNVLRCAEGRLAAADPAEQAALDGLIRAALSGAPGGVMRAGGRNGRRPCALRVSPIRVDDAERFVSPAVLVVATDPAAAHLDQDLACAIYDLTPAEARTAAALVEGHSIHSAAQELAVGAETVRSHLKALFRKLSVSRQQDVIRLLSHLDARVGTSPD
jgi:DNA-binding CsgD family transcriptional regulator